MGWLTARRLLRALAFAAAAVLVGKVFELFLSKDGLETCRVAQRALIETLGDLGIPGLLTALVDASFTAKSYLETMLGWGSLGTPGLVLGYLIGLVLAPIEMFRTATALTWWVAGFEILSGILVVRFWPKGQDEEWGCLGVLFAPLLVIIAGTLVASALWCVMIAGLYVFSGFIQLGGFCLGGGVVLNFLYPVFIQLTQDQASNAAQRGLETVIGNNEDDQPPATLARGASLDDDDSTG
ncbi:MAG: hypothetical protein ABI414_01700 [Devosia sp.]